MIKIAALLFLTLLSACTMAPTKKDTPTKAAVNAPEEGVCYVSWKDQATKDAYKKGLGLTHEEKEESGLLFSLASNKIIYVYDRIENTYLVRFEVNDTNGYKLALDLMGKNFLMGDKPDQKLVLYLANMVWKIPAKKLQRILKNYDKVDCYDFSTSVYIPTRGT